MSTQQDATVNIHVNNQEAEQKVKELSDRARQLRQEFAEAVRIGDKGTIAKTEKELRKVNKELNNATLRAARIRDAMKHLSEATPKELRNTLKLINQELNSGAVKRSSKEWEQYQEQIKKVNAELKQIKGESRESQNLFAKIGDFGYKYGNAITGAFTALSGVTFAGRQAVQAYADMDAAMANTQKFTGMTREGVEALNEEFKKMDTRTSLQGLNELAQAAGRLGKNSVEDVLGFVRAGDIIGVAMDELGADAPQIISQLAGIFNIESELGTEKAMLSVGSAINTLSQNCAAGAPNLVDFASRLGAIANSTNMSMDEMLAFGALLDDQKVSVEKASTAMQTVITKMYAEPTKFAKTAGIEAKAFAAALNRSSTEGIMLFVDALSKMDSMQQASTLKELHIAGAGVVQTFQTLAGKTDLLKQQMATSKQAFDEATSATEEFTIQNNTVEAQLDKAKEKFNQMAASLGEKLYPAMKYAISGTSLLMKGMKVLIEFVIEHKGAVITLVSTIVAYNLVVQAKILWGKRAVIQEALMTAKTYAFEIAQKAAAVATALFTNGIRSATVAFKAFSIAIKADPIGLIVSGITLAVGALITWISTAEDASEEAKELADSNEDLKNSYKTLADKTADYAKKEIDELDKLYKAATNETNSKKERFRAAKNLINQYPDYFGKLSTETIMVGKAKDKYDQLTQSIKDSARARALFEMLKDEEKNLLSLQLQRDQQTQKQTELTEHRETLNQQSTEAFNNMINDSLPSQQKYTIEKRNNLPFLVTANDAIPNAKQLERTFETAAITKSIAATNEELKNTEDAIQNINSEISKSEEKIRWMQEQSKGIQITDTETPTFTRPLSDKELKAQEKARQKAEKAAQDALKKELEQKKAARDIEHAENLAAYSLGQKNYLQYIEKKHQIDIDAIAAQKKVLEDAKLTETQEYAKLLKKEQELNAQHLQTQSQLKIEQLDREHKAKENEITSKYLDPKDNTYSSEKSYRQALFDLDIDYLKKKRDAFQIDSKEWADLNYEINDKIDQDQLQKQKETNDALLHFQEEYGKASGSAREKMELDILDNLHQQGLITEEECNKARNAIREKYRNEDREKERTVQSEYADMVVNLYDSFKKFFDELGKDGTNFWENLSNASQAAFAVMGAALSQYSAYADAERDLELAQVEHRYDAEIESAGKNSKKKEQLEKQKEAEIALVKKKHNDRAMKIEIAQAVAQTAMAAISAYASAASIPVVGWVMAPIAAALAVAAGAVQIATIKKQHQAQAIGYYEGGYTGKSLNNHKEVGVVHANEFVANHKAVANPRLAPLFNLLDSAQRNNTVGSLTAQDVSNALGQGRGVTARAEVANTTNEQVGTGLALVGTTLSSAGDAIDRLNQRIDDGIETVMIMDGERGFARKYENYNKRIKNAKR